MSKFIDRTGQRFGRLRVVRRSDGSNPVRWVCICYCGKWCEVRAGNLHSGNVTSCGCKGTSNTHGMSDTREYTSYHMAKGRCNNTRNPKYYMYGGAGTQFRFTSLFQFLSEVGPRPAGTSLDRWPNPAGHYEPGNVRWATPKEQANNKRCPCSS